MRYALTIVGALLLAGLLTARPARAGEDTVWTPALLDGRSCSVTNADDEAIVAEAAILDADGVELAGPTTLSLEPGSTATVEAKPQRVYQPFACRVRVAKASSVRVALCQVVDLASGELLASCVPGS